MNIVLNKVYTWACLIQMAIRPTALLHYFNLNNAIKESGKNTNKTRLTLHIYTAEKRQFTKCTSPKFTLQKTLLWKTDSIQESEEEKIQTLKFNDTNFYYQR